MRRDQPDKVILVCHWQGRSDRFFGKYKSFETGKWLKIPGGAFPPAFDTKEKALMFAREWHDQAQADRDARARVLKLGSDPTWDAICDAYLATVNDRMRGKPSTRDEAINVTDANIRRGLLASGKPSHNDEDRCVKWLRFIAHENIARRKGSAPRYRKPMTVRNIAKQLRYVFKTALRLKMIPGLIVNPTQGEEFRAELKDIVSAHEQRDWLVPLESFAKLVVCPRVPAHRRIVYLTLGLTGLRPGELAGLQMRHVLREGDVGYFYVEQQWTLPRGKTIKGALEKPKTKWGRRNVPLHRALRGPLDEWLTHGWEAWTGRAPQPNDYLFPDDDGKPHRERHGRVFRADLEAAECDTDFEGEALKPYALRHLFSTLLTEAHASDAAHDRLLGHRPRDTKTLNYSAKLLPFLSGEVELIPFDLPDDAPAVGVPLPSGSAPASEGRPAQVGPAPAVHPS